MVITAASVPTGEARSRTPRGRPSRSPSIRLLPGGPGTPVGGTAVAVPLVRLRDRAGAGAFEPRTRRGLDRAGRDRTDQRAAALRSLDRMHRLAPGDAERGTLRDAVITEYMHYARHVAGRYGVYGLSAEDFVQTAYVGLIKAVDNFDPDFGAGFLAFATPTILGELKRYFRDTTWVVHVPRRIQELSTGVGIATEALLQRLKRDPTVDELAVMVGVDRAEVIDAIAAAGLHAVGSLDLPAATEEGDGSVLSDLLGIEDREFQNIVDRETLRPLLATLSAREKQILLMRFFQSMTQTEIGKELGVSQMQVSRLLTDILGRLRTLAGCDTWKGGERAGPRAANASMAGRDVLDRA